VDELESLPWDPKHTLRPYFEGLRDRLITYFEVRKMTHKPKLVAVTSASRGAGVSTMAAGLAATLSETGDGNVLLVDMNIERGAVHPFHQGLPGCALSEALEQTTREPAQIQDNLYVVTAHEGNSGNADKLPSVLPKRFAHLIPKMKASDYDYIIFDMPPVSQTSVTARLAGFMDMMLLVVESEKTGQDIVKRASGLLTESRANIATVLNKQRSYVPPALSQDL
jgi:Mrp family chromosome partitioning ATPase